MKQNNNDRPEGWGKRGPKPKAPTEGVITGLPVGRDKTVVPQEQVEELAHLGCTNKEIANFFGVKEDAISRNFAVELVKGRETMKIKLRRAMFKNAVVNENTTMQIWLSKQYLGMTDQPVNSEANAPLPWSNDSSTVGETDDNEELRDDIPNTSEETSGASEQ